MTIIQHAVWLYHRFPLSDRDVQELLHRRSTQVSHETEVVYAAMELSKSLLSMAHELAGQVIQISSFQSEADRVAAAKRQVKLTGELFEQLQAVTMGTPS